MKPIQFKMIMYTENLVPVTNECNYINKTGMLASMRRLTKKSKFKVLVDAWAVYADGSKELILDKSKSS